MTDRPGSGPDKLSELGKRIEAARTPSKPTPRKGRDEYTAASMAWRMVIELVVAVMVGAAMGWGLDSLFGSLPLFLIVFVLLGFASGVRLMLRSAEDMQRTRGAETDEKNGGA